MAWLWSRLGGAVAAVGAVLAVLGGAWFAGRRSGQGAAQSAAQAAEIETRRTMDAVDRAVAREPDPVGVLRRDWSRD